LSISLATFDQLQLRQPRHPSSSYLDRSYFTPNFIC
jgi:hypothetical protein